MKSIYLIIVILLFTLCDAVSVRKTLPLTKPALLAKGQQPPGNKRFPTKVKASLEKRRDIPQTANKVTPYKSPTQGQRRPARLSKSESIPEHPVSSGLRRFGTVCDRTGKIVGLVAGIGTSVCAYNGNSNAALG